MSGPFPLYVLEEKLWDWFLPPNNQCESDEGSTKPNHWPPSLVLSSSTTGFLKERKLLPLQSPLLLVLYYYCEMSHMVISWKVIMVALRNRADPLYFHSVVASICLSFFFFFLA